MVIGSGQKMISKRKYKNNEISNMAAKMGVESAK